MQMMTEFDYSNEANNLVCVRNNMAKSPYASQVVVPEPILDLCSKRLLVMEFLSGRKLASHIEGRLASILDGDIKMARKVLKAKQQTMFQSNDENKDLSSSQRFLQQVNDILGDNRSLSKTSRCIKALQLAAMTHDARKRLSLLLDVTGHQIFNDGIYNGDPHPGNILVLDCGKLGLIDYGQTRRLTKNDRLALAEVVASVGESIHLKKNNLGEIARAMRQFGFRSRDSNDENTAKFAALYFDSDDAGRKLGYVTPQKYLQYLNSIDPMIEVPDAAVFVARTSFLFRGLGALLQQSLHTSHHWRKHALLAIETNGDGRPLYNLGLSPPVV
jgi:aarF domain-containing kinase